MNFLKFNEILKKHPDDLKKYVVNKVRRLKKFKGILLKVAKKLATILENEWLTL